MGETGSDGRLWAFATSVYGRAGVSEACLTLQDRYGQDVLLLLFAAWAGAQGGLVLSPEQMAQANTQAAGWRGGVVEVLRDLRRRLKGDPATSLDEDVAALREDIKRAELAAERIALTRLERAAPPWPTHGDAADLSDTAERNLARAFETAAGHPPDTTAAGLLRIVGDAAIACRSRTSPIKD
jgi:uncharacterized protein (TIGR02444 family)